MNQEVKKLWLDALRSGEYQQTKGRLMKEMPDGSKGYCCLGVLCRVAGLDDIDIEGFCYPQSNFSKDIGLEGDISNIKIEYYHERLYLGELNDDKNLSFNEIADIIEESDQL